jgi:hypothetical protein
MSRLQTFPPLPGMRRFDPLQAFITTPAMVGSAVKRAVRTGLLQVGAIVVATVQSLMPVEPLTGNYSPSAAIAGSVSSSSSALASFRSAVSKPSVNQP